MMRECCLQLSQQEKRRIDQVYQFLAAYGILSLKHGLCELKCISFCRIWSENREKETWKMFRWACNENFIRSEANTIERYSFQCFLLLYFEILSFDFLQLGPEYAFRSPKGIRWTWKFVMSRYKWNQQYIPELTLIYLLHS